MNRTVYVKTTETCNLNCMHCFTNGRDGRRIFFDPVNTIRWVNQLIQRSSNGDSIHIEFHGGEPFLADTADIWTIINLCERSVPVSFGATSNLVFKLTDDILELIDGPFNKRMGTSWDPTIRFENDKQRQLWESNVRVLVKRGVTVKLFVSVSRDVLELEPINIIKMARDLGVSEIAFERLTHGGNALVNTQIFPANRDIDEWFLRMHQQIVEHDARDWMYNAFMESIYTKFETGLTSGGTFCRDCEETIFTINADGTIAGCPNQPMHTYGSITEPIESILSSAKRIETIACERSRDTRCFVCDVFQHCGGDCHQLAWEGDVCGAPKSLMRHLAGMSDVAQKRSINKHKIIFLRKE